MFYPDPREQFQNQARLNQDLNRKRMTEIVKDSLGQQFNLGNPEGERDIFELSDLGDNSAPKIKIKIKGMLNDAMTKPLPKRGQPSIDIDIS